MLVRGEWLIAVLDTCVLAPMPICDTLLRLAEEPAFYSPRWSAGILGELRTTLQRMGYTSAQADRRISAMTAAFEDAEVIGYEHLIDTMTNHPKDRHVLAAAVRAKAHAIVTFNVRDFGPESLKAHEVSLYTPDRFLLSQIHSSLDLVVEKLAAQALARGVTLDSLLERRSISAPASVQVQRGTGLSQ